MTGARRDVILTSPSPPSCYIVRNTTTPHLSLYPQCALKTFLNQSAHIYWLTLIVSDNILNFICRRFSFGSGKNVYFAIARGLTALCQGYWRFGQFFFSNFPYFLPIPLYIYNAILHLCLLNVSVPIYGSIVLPRLLRRNSDIDKELQIICAVRRTFV